MKAVIQGDTSYVFENLAWRGQLSGWGTNGPIPFSSAAADLFSMLAANLSVAPPNPKDGTSGDSTLAILGDFYAFMYDYNAWAAANFPNGPILQALKNAQSTITDITQNMAK